MTESQDRKNRREAAARWFVELQADDLAPETWVAFLAWEKDPQNASVFRDIEAAVGIIDRLPDTRLESPLSAAQEVRPGKGRARRTWFAAAAACVATVLAMPFLLPKAAPSQMVYRTQIGERSEITLQDGSTLLLNTDTELSVSYSDEARSIRLAHGEALFRVHKSDRPFFVDAVGTRTRALGTEFDVRAEAGTVSVTLYDGSVVVAPEGAGAQVSSRQDRAGGREDPGVRLSPGQRVTVRAGAAPDLHPVDPDVAKSWREGTVRFDKTTLEDAVHEMNRYSTTKIHIRDASLSGERISGSFPAGRQESFAESLSLTLGLQVRHEDNGILITRASEQ